MLGAIAGDIIGSVYEFRPVPWSDFPLWHPACHFTDDTVLTVAQADHILTGEDWPRLLKAYYTNFRVGYGPMFARWASSDSTEPYGSHGNGSAMRVSPIGWAFDDLDAVLAQAERSAAVTHDHPEGIAGAQAIAAAVFLARTGTDKPSIAAFLSRRFGYDLARSVEEIRPTYGFDPTCAGSVPQAVRAFLDSTDFESAVRLAVSLGGDADTLACMAGAIAEAFYGGVPRAIRMKALALLDPALRAKTLEFVRRYSVPMPGEPAPEGTDLS